MFLLKLNLLGKIMSDNIEAEAANLVDRIFLERDVQTKAVYLGTKELMTLLRSIHMHSCIVNESTFLCRKFKIFGLPIVEVNQQSYFRVV